MWKQEGLPILWYVPLGRHTTYVQESRRYAMQHTEASHFSADSHTSASSRSKGPEIVPKALKQTPICHDPYHKGSLKQAPNFWQPPYRAGTILFLATQRSTLPVRPASAGRGPASRGEGRLGSKSLATTELLLRNFMQMTTVGTYTEQHGFWIMVA